MDFDGTAVATHLRHRDVSNLDTSLGHKAIPHNPNGERARRIAGPRGERLDTGLSLDLHRRWPSPQCASLDRHMIRPIDGLEAALAASDAPMNSLDHHDRGCPYGYVTATRNANGIDTELSCGPECLATPP